MKPGIYPDLSREEYENIEAINYSILKHFDKSPAHARHEMLHPKKPTPAMETGQMIHKAILEPKRFYEDYIQAPLIDRRTKEGKAAWAKFEAENPGKIYLAESDWYQFKGMMASCKNNYNASQLLYGRGRNEVTVVWEDEETGLLCKARLDRMTKAFGWSVLVDIKTCMNAQKWAFESAVAKFNYHLQAAFYLDSLNTLSKSINQRRYILLAIEKDPPFAIQCFELNESSLIEGRDKYRFYLKQYKECLETDVWPGYPDTIEEIGIPQWAFNTYEEEIYE